MIRGGALLVFMASLAGHVIGQLQFTQPPTNVTALNGSATMFPCLATGASLIIYVWRKGSEEALLPLRTNSSDRVYRIDGTIQFNEVTLDDDDVYSCMAMDGNNVSNLIISEPVYLTVILPLTVSPDLLTVRNSTAALLHCVAIGDTDNITYNWYHEDILLNEHHVVIMDNGSLLISVTDYRRDDGSYYCVTIDRHGNNLTSNFAVLQIAYLEEEFVRSPENETKRLSDADRKGRLYCTPPVGHPPATVSWNKRRSRDGAFSIIEENTKFKIREEWLVINEAEVADSGFYQCAASNGYYDRLSDLAYFNVLLSIPEPCVPLSNATTSTQYAVIGQNLTLNCSVDNSRNVTLSWHTNIRLLNEGGVPLVHKLTNYSDGDHGDYVCRGSNECSRTEVMHIRLETATIGDVLPIRGVNTTGVGTTVKLSCDTPDAKPSATVMWLFNGVAVAMGGRYLVSANNEMLQISDVRLSDDGRYTCRAENIAGIRESSVNVTILESPTVTIGNKIVRLGSVAMLTCMSSSPTVTHIQWRHSDNSLSQDGSKYHIAQVSTNTSTLVITDVQWGDLGQYSCTITDAHHVNVTVIGYLSHTNEIYFTHASNQTQAEEGGSTTITCSVAGAVGDVQFTWYEDLQQVYPKCDHERYCVNDFRSLINGDTDNTTFTSELELVEVGPNVNYTYQCDAKDESVDHGKIVANIFLTTTRKPHFIMEPPKTVEVAEGGVVMLQCKVGGRPQPSITWTYQNLTFVESMQRARGSIRFNFFSNGTLLIRGVRLEDFTLYSCHITSMFDISRTIELVKRTSTIDQSAGNDKIAGLEEDVFLVVMGVVIVVIIYTAIMCLMLFLCCHCRKQDVQHPYTKQEPQISPDPLKEGRVGSVTSRDSIGGKEGLGLTYYDLPHPFSRASSDGRSHDTMELIRLPEINNNGTIASTVTEGNLPVDDIDHYDNNLSNSPGFPRTNLQFTSKLGDGEFGPVYRGVGTDLVPGEPQTLVAIKMLLHSRDGDEDTSSTLLDLHNFQSQMKLQYTNIASILAMCTDTKPYYIIYEYLDCGDLKRFLRNASPEANQPPKLTQHSLLQVILQVADGMSYLSSNKIIHGDLAARNCLISSELRVKVADLGIGHDVYNDDYYDDGTQLLPIRWMPPEILTSAEFSVYSDTWSFGVLCWEVFSFGRQPYEMVSNEELLTLVPQGVQLQIPPEGCPNPLYAIMQECWHLQPDMRPKFPRLCVTIIDLDLD